MELKDIRKQIDACDAELTRLLVERMKCSLAVAEVKKAQNLPLYHPGREQEILQKVRAEGGEYGSYLAEIYAFIMACSRELQSTRLNAGRPLPEYREQALQVNGSVACYGTDGAFTHLALRAVYPGAQPVFFGRFAAVFEAVHSGRCAFGIVPVENSTAGSVREVYDLLLQYKSYIVGSVNMAVQHNLLAKPGTALSAVKTVYSHPQALSQCNGFIRAHGLKAVEYQNTAEAAKLVAHSADGSVAAIGSAYCANEYGLNILAPAIQDYQNNCTRFAVLSNRPVFEPGSNKISLSFATPHTPGALQKILTRFALHGLNLTKLESAAGKGGDFETQFYLDFDGCLKNRDTAQLLQTLADEVHDFAFLGNYRVQKVQE